MQVTPCYGSTNPYQPTFSPETGTWWLEFSIYWIPYTPIVCPVICNHHQHAKTPITSSQKNKWSYSSIPDYVLLINNNNNTVDATAIREEVTEEEVVIYNGPGVPVKIKKKSPTRKQLLAKNNTDPKKLCGPRWQQFQKDAPKRCKSRLNIVDGENTQGSKNYHQRWVTPGCATKKKNQSKTRCPACRLRYGEECDNDFDSLLI